MNKIIRKKCLSIILTLAMVMSLFPAVTLPARAGLTTVYVNSSTGNDTTGNGTASSPYKTFTKGYSQTPSGGVLDLTGTFTWTDASETGVAGTTGFTINRNITVQGHGAGTTIIQAATSSGGNTSRVFTITNGTNGGTALNVILNNLELRYGYLSNADDGGALLIGYATVTINNAYIHHNKARQGFAIDSGNSYLTINNSTIANNSYSPSGSGNAGGAINASSSSGSTQGVTITNSTVTGNTGAQYGGGLLGMYGQYVVTNCTFAYNSCDLEGGGISIGGGGANKGQIYIKNTIVANNVSTTIPNEADFDDKYDGLTHDNGNNIIEFHNSTTLTGIGTITGNRADLNLSDWLEGNDTLNGVPTLALSAGSVAINAGNSTANGSVSIPATDQRGFGRNAGVDIGAFEYDGIAPAPTVTGINPTSGSTAGGTSIAITGTNFTSGSTVSFGGTPATSVTYNSASSLTAVSPAHAAGTVEITVSTASGTSATSAADQFTYVVPNAAPTVTTPDPITYIDTAVSNAFSKVTGNITATDSDGTITFYGITGGTSGSNVIDAVTYDVSKTGTYGTLYVESLTGKYVFAPNLTTINAVSIDQSETFTVTATDNLDAIGTATLTVNIIGANDTPSNLFLSSSSVNQSGGVNAVVGTLSTSDIDSGQTHTYSLVSGAGDTNNASFNISGDALRANNAAVLAAGTYSVRVRTTDSGAGNLTYDRAFAITVADNVAPSVSSVSVPANGTYKTGQNLDFTVNYNENVTVDTSIGTPSIALIIGATTRYATYQSGSGTSALVFRYTVQAGDNDSNGITVWALSANGGTMQDAAGNNATLTLNSIGSTTNVLVDTTSPAVSSIVRYTPANSLTNAASVVFRVAFNESVTGVDISDFALTKTGDADGTVALVSPVSGTIYDVTVNAISGDGTLRLDLNASGTGIEDAGGNAIAGDYATGETYSIDNTAPTAMISMSKTAFYYGETATVTITFSEAVTGFTNDDLTISNGTLTAVSSADGGITWTATFTAANVDAATNAIILDLTGITDMAGNSGSGTAFSGNYSVSMPTAPGAPTNVTATEGDTQASVSFTAPVSNGGAAITSYTVTSSPGWFTGTGAGSPITVAGLTNGVDYTFTVTATNSAGTGAASAASNSVTPRATQTITFNNPGAQSFGTSPTLTATSDSGLPVTFTSQSTGVCTVTPGGVLTFITAGTATITAHQAGDASYLPATSVQQSFTINPVAPGAPTGVTAIDGDTQASVSFTAPVSTGGVAITGYTVTASPPHVAPVNGASSPIVVTGLTNGQAYTFTVTATNSAGTGAASATSNSVTPRATQTITFSNPGAQSFGTSPTLTATSDSGLTVTFTSETPDVCTITSGGVLTFISAGTATITAHQPGNASYLPATSVQRSFTVNPVVPGAPTNVTATAGNAQASVSFTAPVSNGGASITGYTVTSSPGGITATGASSPIAVTGLTNGVAYTFTVTATNSAGTGTASAASNSVTLQAPSGGTSSTSTTPSISAVVEVNGQKQDAGTASTQTTGGLTITTIKVDDTKLDKILASSGEKPTVTLPTNKASDVVVGELNGQTVKNMEQKEAVLEIRTSTVTYTLPAAQINIDDVSSQIGEQVALKDIMVSVKIAEPPADTVKIVENTAAKNSYQIVVKPVEFEITCTSGSKTVTVSKFNGYVERTVAIPDGVDPSKITTGIVLNNDGTFSHVPTQIVVINGKYFAKINSLTNSTYSVIYNPVTFADVANHWAKTAVNDMGSRMVVTGIGNSTYEPERSITRAEFAAIVVRTLGLRQGTEESSFGDVTLTDWFNGYVDTATEYALITGYDSGTFGPSDTITREQAMAIIARAMKLTGMDVTLTDSEVTALLSRYTDSAQVSAYAKESAAVCLKAGIVNGTTTSTISPKSFVTRAEVAVMVQRLLQESGLI